jgi:hypothetical protein
MLLRKEKEMTNDKKIILGLGIVLLFSLIINGYLLGNNGGDQSEQIRLYAELNRKSDITEKLLTDRITRSEEELNTSRELLDKSRKTIGNLQKLNSRRESVDRIAETLSGKLRGVLVESLTGIDSSTARLTGLQEVEQRERQALSGFLRSDSGGKEEK